MNAATREYEDPFDEHHPLAPPAWATEDAEPAAEAVVEDTLAPSAPKARAAGMPATVTEARLAVWIEAIVDHDEQALAALYDATFPRVFGLVRRIVRDLATAEEVVEDTYFQVWRQAARFDPARGKPITWLLALARSRAIDAMRHEARFEHEALDDEGAAEMRSDDAPADELLDLARQRSELQEALMCLGTQPRQLVSLAFFRGLSHEEIAERMHLPLGTVKSQIRRALLSLRQILGSGAPSALAS
jgi:RNA polymerase sigma-70 factor (ECF subfamily)